MVLIPQALEVGYHSHSYNGFCVSLARRCYGVARHLGLRYLTHRPSGELLVEICKNRENQNPDKRREPEPIVKQEYHSKVKGHPWYIEEHHRPRPRDKLPELI